MVHLNEQKAVKPCLTALLDVLDKELEAQSSLLTDLGLRLEPVLGSVKTMIQGDSIPSKEEAKSQLVTRLENSIDRIRDYNHMVKYTLDRLEI